MKARAIELNSRAFELISCAFELISRAFETRDRAFELKSSRFGTRERAFGVKAREIKPKARVFGVRARPFQPNPQNSAPQVRAAAGTTARLTDVTCLGLVLFPCSWNGPALRTTVRRCPKIVAAICTQPLLNPRSATEADLPLDCERETNTFQCYQRPPNCFDERPG